jgi:septal ring factor EnvC (AmiA/AmiB activator)
VAARKKIPSNTPAPPADAAGFVVVLEDIRSQFKVFGDALRSSREESARHFEQIDHRFDQVDHRLDQHDIRFATLDREIREIRRDVGAVRGDLGAVRGDLDDVRSTVGRIEIALASKVNRDEVESIVQRVLGRP